MKKHIIYFLAIAMIAMTGCQKELSIEGSNAPAAASLQSYINGDCLPKTVNGVYIAGTALVPATNTITVQLNVTKTGTYVVYTDTVNGFFFRAMGSFTTLGANTVTLRSSGTPFAQGINNFRVYYDTTFCDIQITVLPVGSGPAVFTLAGAPSCTTPVFAGTYATGTPLNASNTVTLNVNVTTAGTYNVSTAPAVGGMTFTGTGSLMTGAQTIVLTGTGTPTVGGNNTIPVTVGASTCSFVINVLSPAVFTLVGSPTCTTPVIAGTYTFGTPLTAANTVTLNVNVTVAGAYNVSIPTVGNITFAGSGTLALGAQTILLSGTGTPTVGGNNTFPVTVGPSNCSFVINVTGGPAVYTIDCPNVMVNGTYQVGVPLTAANTITLPITVTTAGAYTISASINGMTFSNSGSLTLATTTITLNGSLMPTGPANTYNLSVGTPACLIPITVAAAPVIDWSFMIGATTYSGSTSDVIGLDNTTFPPFTIVDYYGEYGGTPDLLNITLGDPSGGVFTAGEQYNSNFTTIANGAYFYFDALPALELEATDPGTTPGVNLIFAITSHNTATKTIIGTFSGNAFDYVSGTPKTITNGTFKIVYPN